MKIVIAGSRCYSPKEADRLVEDAAHRFTDAEELVSGSCPSGIDQAGERWAKKYGIPIKRFPADWDRHGRAAGPIRNRQMAEYADYVIVIWDGKSRGAKNMMDLASEYDKPHIIIIPSLEDRDDS